MLIVLSPAKTLDYDTPPTVENHTEPEFIAHSAELVGTLQRFSPAQVATLMNTSAALAALNVDRYASWSTQCTPENAKQAILAFKGDVYKGLDATSLTVSQFGYIQSRIRILSGLYGMLRPLDLMQPYRLEMGTPLANSRGRDLYAFWRGVVTTALNKTLADQQAKALINLASEEYFKAVKPAGLEVPVITPIFEDWKNGKYKVISFYAKRARGLMARYAAVKGIVDPEGLKTFDSEGYFYHHQGSTENCWLFRRRVQE